MSRVIETTVYTYAELPEGAAKAAAREWLVEACTDHGWWENTYQDAEDAGLKITGFDLERRALDAEILTSAPEVAETMLGTHGYECDTYKAAGEYLEALEGLGISCDAEDGTPERNAWEEAREVMDAAFLKTLRGCYLKLLESEYEWLCGDEHINEFAEANDYTFTAIGRRFG